MPAPTITISGAPPIPGLRFRHFAGHSDYEVMAGIINLCKKADNVERSDTAETIAAGYQHLHNCDPYEDMCFAEAGRKVIGYSRVWWVEQEDGKGVYYHIGFLVPEWRRRRIGTAILGWNQQRLRRLAQDHAGTPKVFRSFADGGEVGTMALLDSDGYRAVTYGAEMSRPVTGDLPTAPLPAGLEIRPVEPRHLRAIWEADVEAFRDHWGARPPTESDWEAFLDRPHTDPSLWKVAWEGDRVVGQVRSFINPDENAEYGRLRGYTEDISTIKEWRGRGVARALICESMRALKERGMEEVGLGVHTENPTGAYHLYSSLGYQVNATSTVYEKPLS